MFSDKIRNYFLILFLFAITFSAGCSYKISETTPVLASDSFDNTSSDPEVNSILALIRKAPDSPAGYVQLASVYIKKARKTGDFDTYRSADIAIDRALELKPDDGSARRLKASLHLTFHRFQEALALGKELQKESPDEAFIYGVLTDANAELGNYDEALKAAQKMVDLRPNTASYARAGHMRFLYGDHKGAVEMFKLAAKTADPVDHESQSWCLVQLGDELWKNGNYVEAENVYDEALQIFPDFYLALAGKGNVRASQNDLDSAIKFLNDSQDRNPNVKTVVLLADVYQKAGNEQESARQAELVEIVDQKIGVKGDQKMLALFWADRGMKLDQALSIAESEYAIRKDIYTADVLAWCLYKNGRFAEAAETSKAAMKLGTKDSLILYHAGMISNKLGQKADAKRLLGSALQLNPEFDLIQADVARKTLEELQ